MAQITFTIADAKIDRIKNALAGLYPIPMTDDIPPVPQFTKTQWAKECVRRWIIKQVARWEQAEAQKNIAYNE